MNKVIFSLLAISLLFASCKQERVEEVGKPSPKVSEVTETSVKIEWEPVRNVRDYCWKLDDGEIVSTETPEVYLMDLEPGREYMFSVQAVAEEGSVSEWSSIEFRTSVGRPDFTFEIPDGGIGAYHLKCKIIPADMESTYYVDVVSRSRWESDGLEKIIAEKQESIRSYADMMEISYDKVLDQLLAKGITDYESKAGFKPETEYVIVAMTWTSFDSPSMDAETYEYRSLQAEEASGNIEVVYSEISQNKVMAKISPSANVLEYYYYFDKKTAIDQLLTELDEQAWISYESMNKGVRYTGEQKVEHPALNVDTEYSALLMGIEDNGARFSLRYDTRTLKEGEVEKIESELFTNLLGKWNARQTVNDLFAGPSEVEFEVEIVTSVPDYDYDYRAKNQLVAIVRGWQPGMEYYGIQELIEQGIENPEEKFGPKLLLNIAKDDVVTIDGQAKNSVVGWMFFGAIYMFNMSPDGQTIHTDNDIEVNLSEDLSQMTISSPASLEGCYPGLAYYFDGIGWMSHLSASSNIVLTRQ